MNNLLIFIFLTLFSCCSFEKPEPYIIEVNKLLGKSAQYIEEKYTITCIGDQVSIPSGNFRGLGLSFQKYGEISQEEIEQILFDVAYDLLKRVNSSVILKSQMAEYPFTLNQINVKLFLSGTDGQKFYYPESMSVSLTSGKFYYLAQNKETLAGIYTKKYPASESKYYRGEK